MACGNTVITSAPLMTNKGLVGGANICEAALKP